MDGHTVIETHIDVCYDDMIEENVYGMIHSITRPLPSHHNIGHTPYVTYHVI
jgi:hypothetical protein